MKHWHETRAVLDRLAELRRAGRRAALATVVRVRGSAYRHEGAKLLVAEDGSTVGNVSGGCLEQDVREVALQVLGSGTPELKSYCSSSDEIAAWDLGVGCEGQVDVLVEPVVTDRPRERALLDGREPFVVCTLIDGKRETLKDSLTVAGNGKRMIVTRGEVQGDLGRAELSGAAAAQARELLGTEDSRVVEIAGRAIFCDVFLPPPELVICGAGDDARPLARFAADIGFRVVIVDRRAAYLTAERFPTAAALVESRPEELLQRLSPDAACYAVVMTHNFADDQGYLRALVGTPAPYIGMLGPRQRTERMLQALGTGGGGPGERDAARIYGPVGLDVGTDGAEQVALSVIAEILAVRSGRRADSLRERQAPIHAATEWGGGRGGPGPARRGHRACGRRLAAHGAEQDAARAPRGVAGAARGAARPRGGTLACGDGAGPRGGPPPRRARRSPVRLRHQSRLHGPDERVASPGLGTASRGHGRGGRAARRHGARDPADARGARGGGAARGGAALRLPLRRRHRAAASVPPLPVRGAHGVDRGGLRQGRGAAAQGRSRLPRLAVGGAHGRGHSGGLHGGAGAHRAGVAAAESPRASSAAKSRSSEIPTSDTTQYAYSGVVQCSTW